MLGGSTMTIEKKPRVVFENDPETDKRFFDAFDAREAGRIESDAFGRAATKVWTAAEVARVQAVLAEDRAYRSAEQDRKRARIEVGNGSFANLVDTVMPPTPEWLAKGEVKPFTPQLHGEGGRTFTVKTVRTVRRVLIPMVRKMHLAGKLGDEHYAACIIYRTDCEAAGVEGRFKTSNFSLAGNVGGGGGNAQHPMAQHAFEAEAREAFRAAQSAITPFYLLFLDKVVLDDVPLSRAWRFARCPRDKAESRFRAVVAELFTHYKSVRREGAEDEQD